MLILQRHLLLACLLNADKKILAANVRDPANDILLPISYRGNHDTSLRLENLLPLSGFFLIEALLPEINKRGALLTQKEAIRVRLDVILIWWSQSIKF